MLTHAQRTHRRMAIAEAIQARMAESTGSMRELSKAVREVAATFGVTEATVRSAVRLYGPAELLAASGKAASLDIVRDLIAADRGRSADSFTTIADRHGVSRQYVSALARRVGIRPTARRGVGA